ncbi:ABC transporter substrate-binding protein [Methylocystis sp. ATCC 49242]|uniref:ABC transporter substrate-binding protein n=1 Tax=Methylocystis sp. ATCC 49242 TaxID=622637 RepID=UPI0001F8760E|nr:ABC transporter substrate-binding protein [Methylocystis sp. ATCC 49242]
MRLVRLASIFFTVVIAAPASALDKVSFATNWRAQAEHGGFYQAVVDGTYKSYGLDVNIQQGGPQINARLLLAAGRVDFAMGANTIQMFEAVQQKVPVVTVASMFQIDPVIFMSHPGEGLDRFEDLPKATAFVANDMLVSVWIWLKQAYGFRDDKVKPYGFNSAPFIADRKSIQQGFLTSEPYAIERQGGFKPNVFLLPDYGYDSYSTTIEARADTIARNPDLVQRFVDASIIGWYNYIYGDNAAANAVIKRDNPEMTDGQIAYSLEKIKERGIVDSGDALTLGVGVMTDARMKSFFDKMAKAGVVPDNLDYKRGYTLQFIGKKVGMDLRPKQ